MRLPISPGRRRKREQATNTRANGAAARSRLFIATLRTVVAGVLMASPPLAATAFAADAQAIAASGNGAGAPACSTCHGQGGEGRPDAGYPRLAGLNAHYLLLQLNDFADGNRASDTMHPVAKALRPNEREAMASYYASLSAPKAAGEKKADGKVLAVGAALAQRGDWAKGLPACAQCHGPSGQGVGSSFPKLAGQSAQYIAAQLNAWKAGRRRNDPLHLMTGVASKLDDQQIAAAAAYYASLDVRPPASANEGRKP